MKAMSPEVKKVQLQDHSFLLSLTSQGSVYQGYSAAQTIRIGASADDYGCWAAYYQTPSTRLETFSDMGISYPRR